MSDSLCLSAAGEKCSKDHFLQADLPSFQENEIKNFTVVQKVFILWSCKEFKLIYTYTYRLTGIYVPVDGYIRTGILVYTCTYTSIHFRGCALPHRQLSA